MLNQKPIWVPLNHLLNMVKGKHQSCWFGALCVIQANAVGLSARADTTFFSKLTLKSISQASRIGQEPTL